MICSERNSEITHYLLQYSLEERDRMTEVRVLGTNDSDRVFIATRLQPLSEYTFTIAAVNGGGQRGPNTTVTTMTSAPESKINYNILQCLYCSIKFCYLCTQVLSFNFS